MRQGFTLLEILIGTLISSILSTILMYVISQATHLQRVVDSRVQTWVPLSIIEHQIERDIMGVFVPIRGLKQAKKKEKNKKPKDEKNPSSPELPSTQELRRTGRRTGKVKKLENVFYVKRGGTGIEQFSFITTTVLPNYNQAKIHIARVVYTVVPDSDDSQVFSLVRQEGSELELEPYVKQDSAFLPIALSEHIAGMNMRFVILKPKEDKSGIDFVFSDMWPMQEEQKENGKKEPELLVPDFVEITLSIWRNRSLEKKEAISWYVPIVAVSSLGEGYKKE